jgi:hypothetical protein
MADLNTIKEILATAAETSSKAFELQTSFYTRFNRRQGEALSTLADLRVNSLKEMAGCDSLDSAVEKNSEFNQQAGELIEELYSENVDMFTSLSNELKDLYKLK